MTKLLEIKRINQINGQTLFAVYLDDNIVDVFPEKQESKAHELFDKIKNGEIKEHVKVIRSEEI